MQSGKMKVGDECWVWSPWACRNVGKIERGIVTEIPIDAPFVAVKLGNRERPYNFMVDEVFPTREALCEHYRKVFE